MCPRHKTFSPVLLGILILANCAGIAFAQNPPPAPPTLIFLLAGQSNMEGLADALLLPQAFKAQPPNVLRWNGNAGAWEAMAAKGNTFGPEVSFAYAVATALPHERIGIVKFAKGGTAIAEWAPRNPQSLFGELMRQYRAAIAAAPNGQTAAMLWMQGERDSRQQNTATIYGSKLKELVTVVRTQVNDPKMVFLCGVVNPPAQTYPFVGKVRDAQTALPQKVNLAAFVPSDGLPKKEDNLHYNESGQLELGLRFAQAYLTVNKEKWNQANKGAAPLNVDPFANGEIWGGKRQFDPPVQAPPEPLWLIVTQRNDVQFQGQAIFVRKGPKTDIYKVTGTATNANAGNVNFKTEARGAFQLGFNGQLINGQLKLQFNGPGILANETVSGSATLKP